MKKHLFFILINLYFCLPLIAQRQDRNWVFGDSLGIDFNDTMNPLFFTSNCNNFETNASLSNPNGNLKVYLAFESNGDGTIKNYQNVTIENGDSINNNYSATNGAIFLPLNLDTLKCDFISIGFGGNFFQLNYSTIDLSYNGGLANAIDKNIFLIDSLTEHLLAIRHGNGRDWWLISKMLNTNKFVKFLVCGDEVLGPYFQSIGSISFQYQGECAASKNGKKIVFVSGYGNIDLFDFDRCTGEFNNWKELGTAPYDVADSLNSIYYGCEFSPDETKIFITRIIALPASTFLYQYNISDEDSLITKKTLLVSNSYALYQMQLAPDDKIYIAGGPGGGGLDSSYKYLSVINNPNDTGINCNVQLFNFYLGGHQTFFGLPNMPNYNLSALDESACDTLGLGVISKFNVQSSIINIYPNPAQDELTIEILNGVGVKEISITDATGKQLINFTPHKPSTQINVKMLSMGLYFVKVQQISGEVEVKKFVKQ